MRLIKFSLLIASVNGFSRSIYQSSSPVIRTTTSVPLTYHGHVHSSASTCGHNNRHELVIPLLSSTSSSEIDDEAMNKKVKGRKKRVNAGYSISCLLFSIQAFVFMIKKKTSGGLYIASFPIMVSAIAYILNGAAENNRLSSDTYKRLNLYMAQSGFIGLITLFQFSSNRSKMIPYFIIMVNSIKGYGYGVKDWTLKREGASFVQDFLDGCKNSVKTLVTPPKNTSSIVYLCMTVTAAIWKLMKLIEIYYYFMAGGDNKRTLMNALFQYSHLALLTAVTFTLKDAADRDRLDGTTFIQLNFISSFFWIAKAISFFSMLTKGSMSYYVGPAGVGIFGIFSLRNALVSMKNKKQKNKT